MIVKVISRFKGLWYQQKRSNTKGKISLVNCTFVNKISYNNFRELCDNFGGIKHW